ncbi:MAG: inositol monophosphatase family protein [Gemmatimonadota bacterium]
MSSAAILLEAVAAAAAAAGEVALGYFRRQIVVESKADGSPVTEADREAERAARSRILAEFPDDGIVGEELRTQVGTTGRRWLIDPIDGTKSFVRGVPLWGSMVAVEEQGRVIAGAICCAAAGVLMTAADDLGCWLNNARCRVSDVSAIEDATVLTTDDRFPSSPSRRSRWGELSLRASVSRTWGDCYGYTLVASGQAELMVDDRLSPWDAAALMPIMREAGGVFTDFNGRHSLAGSDAVATNLALAEELRSALGVPELR